MASSSMERVLYCGFKSIGNIDTFFKKKSVKRGRKLFAANHVYGVREELASAAGPSDVLGKCVAQMKGVDYDVRLEISANPRQIVGASCGCKAGCRGWCKHAAAVAIYINEHDVVSCTDVPCEWRKPSARPTLDAKKSVEELFPSRPLPVPTLQPVDPAAVLQAFPGVTCSLARVLQPQDSPVEEEGQILPSEENGSYQNFITTMICGGTWNGRSV